MTQMLQNPHESLRWKSIYSDLSRSSKCPLLDLKSQTLLIQLFHPFLNKISNRLLFHLSSYTKTFFSFYNFYLFKSSFWYFIQFKIQRTSIKRQRYSNTMSLFIQPISILFFHLLVYCISVKEMYRSIFFLFSAIYQTKYGFWNRRKLEYKVQLVGVDLRRLNVNKTQNSLLNLDNVKYLNLNVHKFTKDSFIPQHHFQNPLENAKDTPLKQPEKLKAAAHFNIQLATKE